jgi:hypothetical protein
VVVRAEQLGDLPAKAAHRRVIVLTLAARVMVIRWVMAIGIVVGGVVSVIAHVRVQSAIGVNCGRTL